MRVATHSSISMTSQLRGISSFYRKAILEADPMHMRMQSLSIKKSFKQLYDQDRDCARHLMKEHIENDYKVFMKSACRKIGGVCFDELENHWTELGFGARKYCSGTFRRENTFRVWRRSN